jgi:predicted enzyme related to lactoylglutathione lyase
MAKVIGVGGVFFKSRDTAALSRWYADVLGMPLQDWGGILLLPDAMAAHPGAATKEFMINLAVDDLDGVLANCAKHGVTPVKTFPDEPNGRFAHIMDPEGNKIELWQPKPMA